jgi:hypothetical protein
MSLRQYIAQVNIERNLERSFLLAQGAQGLAQGFNSLFATFMAARGSG